jgi:DNA-binding transcriptional MerR regulator
MAKYAIRDLEKITGIRAHTIRIWEKRYQNSIPNRTPTNIRYYNDDELRRLLNISILLRSGYKISKIAVLNNEELCKKVLMASQNSFYPESIIENLTLSMIELDENKFDHLISNQIIKLGFEDTFIKVIQPFFEHIGVLWQAGSISTTHEHFISNLVRQKLMVAIESQHHQVVANDKLMFVLFLPEGEWHELGLLFFQYILKKRGIKSLYLGQSVPIRDLIKVISTHKIDYAITCITTSVHESVIADWIDQLSIAFYDKKVFISGRVMDEYKFPFPHNVVPLSNIRFESYLNDIESSL